MKYSPQLDGLRAIAILAVLVFHALPGSLRGGFAGVDVFFVLSGYLITSVILHEVRDGTFRLREFYLRRIQRLLPNAVITVLATAALATVALLPSAAVKVAQHGLWTILNLSNIYIRNHVGGYWGDSAAAIPLLHTWSLAVEEQFYVFFPWTLWWLARRPRTTGVMLALAATSLVFCILGASRYPVAAFYLLPFRAWELLMGAVLAIHRVPTSSAQPLRTFQHSRWREALGWVGVALMVAGFIWIRDDQGFPGAVALIPTLGALAVIFVTVDGEGALGRWLAHPFMVTTGKLSYSLYLWHWPLIVIGRQYADLTGRPPQAGALVGAGASVLVSALAYRFIERPLRNRGPGRGQRLAIIAGSFAACAIVCTVLARRDTTSGPRALFDQPTYHGESYNLSERRGRRTPVRKDWSQASGAARVSDVEVAPAALNEPRGWNTGGIVHPWGGGPPRVVVLGSSHALMYSALIDDICRQRRASVAFFAADAASVFSSTLLEKGGESFPEPGMAIEFVRARMKWIRAWRPDVVFVIDRWDLYAAAPDEMRHGLRALAKAIGPHANEIAVLSQVPVLRLGEQVNLREVAYWYHRNTHSLPRLMPDAQQGFRDSSLAMIDSIARECPRLRLLRMDPPFRLEDGSVRYAAGRAFYYMDDDHLTDAGVALVRPLVEAELDSALARGAGR